MTDDYTDATHKNELGADAAAVEAAGQVVPTDPLSRAVRKTERDRSELMGFTHRGFSERVVNDAIDNYRRSVIEEVIAVIMARAAVDTVTVKPGMWFAAGWVRQEMIENATQSLSDVSGSARSARHE